MKQNIKSKIFNIKFFFFMILFAITISLYATIYGSNLIYHADGSETIREIDTVSTTALPLDDDIKIITKTHKSELLPIHAVNVNKILSIFSCSTIPISFDFLTISILVFLVLYSNLFLSLPDGWTLVNQRVRLDD